MLKESLTTGFIINEIFKPITKFRAFELGIIDEHGNKIKEPLTEEEKSSYTPITKTLIKIKRYLGSKLDLINQSTILEKESSISYTKETHKTLLEFEDKFNNIFAELHEVTDEALRSGLSLEQIESLLRK
jgi:hypothetical protein